MSEISEAQVEFWMRRQRMLDAADVLETSAALVAEEVKLQEHREWLGHRRDDARKACDDFAAEHEGAAFYLFPPHVVDDAIRPDIKPLFQEEQTKREE